MAQGSLQLWYFFVSPKGTMAMAGGGRGTFWSLWPSVALAMSPSQLGQPWLTGSGRGTAFPRVPRGCGLRRAEPGEPRERAGEVRKTPIKPH